MSVHPPHYCYGGRVTPRRQDAKMLGFLHNFRSNLMGDGIERIVDGLEAENLGVA